MRTPRTLTLLEGALSAALLAGAVGFVFAEAPRRDRARREEAAIGILRQLAAAQESYAREAAGEDRARLEGEEARAWKATTGKDWDFDYSILGCTFEPPPRYGRVRDLCLLPAGVFLLLDEEFAGALAPEPKSGLLVPAREIETTLGYTLRFSLCEPDASGYRATMAPVRPGRGARFFTLDETGVIRARRGAPASSADSPVP